jgi:prophage regulatory protein
MHTSHSVAQTLTHASATPRSIPLRFIRLSEAMRITGLRKTTMYQLQANGEFPQRVQITAHCVGWIESEIQQWISERADGRPSALPTAMRPGPARPSAAAIR